MKEAGIWIQMEKPGKVFLAFQAQEGGEKSTMTKMAVEKNAQSLQFILKDLEPGTTYNYSFYIEKPSKAIASGSFSTQKLWQHREDPPNFSFATGSCAYINEAAYDRPGEPYGRGYEIFESIHLKKPEFMLWLGDNIYLREPDWSTWSGMVHRYSHFRKLPELQNMWKSMHHYAIWDDHDYGNNDANRSFYNKELSLKAFKTFWMNPSYGKINGEGITSQFSYNDLDFFLLDNRYFRSPNERKTGTRQILGEEQIEWLIDALLSSKASFKIVAVGGQVLSPAAVYENHATFARERQKLIDLIDLEGIKNVIFLDGDRHKTELTKYETKSGLILYDYTCSPLSSKAYDTANEGNSFRVEGTHVATQNFGILELSGPFETRTLGIKTFNAKGELIWEKVIEKQ